MRAEELTLNQLTAHDELAFTRNTARVLALVLPDIGEVGRRWTLARNCVTVFCATRGQIPEVRTPGGADLPPDAGGDRRAGGPMCPGTGRLV